VAERTDEERESRHVLKSDDITQLMLRGRQSRDRGWPIREHAAKDSLSTTDVVHRLCDEEKRSRTAILRGAGCATS
jgi:hypothetical protein